MNSIDPAGAPGAPAPAQTAPAIDVSVLQELVGDDPPVLRELLAQYQDSARRLAEELRIAAAAGDVRQIDAIAHQLKSSSRTVGATLLGELCAELENACRIGAWEGISTCMVRVEAALIAVIAHRA